MWPVVSPCSCPDSFKRRRHPEEGPERLRIADAMGFRGYDHEHFGTGRSVHPPRARRWKGCIPAAVGNGGPEFRENSDFCGRQERLDLSKAVQSIQQEDSGAGTGRNVFILRCIPDDVSIPGCGRGRCNAAPGRVDRDWEYESGLLRDPVQNAPQSGLCFYLVGR